MAKAGSSGKAPDSALACEGNTWGSDAECLCEGERDCPSFGELLERGLVDDLQGRSGRSGKGEVSAAPVAHLVGLCGAV